MHHRFFYIICGSIVALANWSCSRNPSWQGPTFKHGWVIAQESCHIDSSKNYWLIDFNDTLFGPLPGDTLVINGVTYHHVLKTDSLAPNLQILGQKIVVINPSISAEKKQSTGCDVATPVTYLLKEVKFEGQGWAQ